MTMCRRGSKGPAGPPLLKKRLRGEERKEKGKERHTHKETTFIKKLTYGGAGEGVIAANKHSEEG